MFFHHPTQTNACLRDYKEYLFFLYEAVDDYLTEIVFTINRLYLQMVNVSRNNTVHTTKLFILIKWAMAQISELRF